MRPLPHTHSCFVCGESNPVGLKLIMHTDGHQVFTTWRPAQEHAGFKTTVHGGLTTTVLDEVMAWVCAVETRRFAFSAELNVRFLNPVRPGRQLTATARLTGNRKNRIFETEAELLDEEGTRLAAATGKYLPISPSQAAPLLDDIVGDLSPYVDLP